MSPKAGKGARQAGHDWERDCAKAIKEATGLDIITTRAIGANYGADLAAVTARDEHGRPVESRAVILGWSIECKNTAKWEPEKWMDQARGQKIPGSRPLVLAKKRHHPLTQAWAIMEDPNYGLVMTTFGRWLLRYQHQSELGSPSGADG